MENKGKITTVVIKTKWYETKSFVVRRTTKNLKKWISDNLKRKKIKLETNALVSQCKTCGALKITTHWKLVDCKPLHKHHYNNTNACEYCWTKR